MREYEVRVAPVRKSDARSVPKSTKDRNPTVLFHRVSVISRDDSENVQQKRMMLNAAESARRRAMRVNVVSMNMAVPLFWVELAARRRIGEERTRRKRREQERGE
jgi:hypothetical protein